MARLVHLNGPPGIGKSTLSALFTDRNPGTLNLDIDALHRLVGGWQHEQTDTWPLVWSLARAMAATHLDGGRDVVVPQYHGQLDEIAALEDLARMHGADFREIVLLDEQEAAINRFNLRAKDSDDPWIRHHHRLIELSGGAAVLETMYVNLIKVVRQRPGTTVVPSTEGAVAETYKRLSDALREPSSRRPDSR
ncbi:AAA family ATPase [Actinoplanes sp. LDG1-06]|uniref:AAA family ATPase n=1 Tax=Paractinoplanes ovalisporus TaxID=2810368 RepID=A0ABS2ALH0_9ACTN|nr:AAA family ATPase [Actinoplanes ovalisporus]MBM2620613.1 AAA family ATPase [Actinoplanes ovalisporus]